MRSVAQVHARAGVGLEGDRYAAGAGHYSDEPGDGRHITLIEAEVIDALRSDHGIDLLPGSTRRNLTTRGIALNALVGRRFMVGEAMCQGMRLCEACRYLGDLL